VESKSLEIPDVPKAELHLHLEGAARPALVRRLAQRNGITLDDKYFDGEEGFAWSGFLNFLDVFDALAQVIRSADDYRDITFEYLAELASEGCIYAELMTSPDHAAAVGLSYAGHLEGVVRGIEEARAAYGIEAFIVVTCVRHFGVEQAEKMVREVVANPHPLVVGFGMGGDEAGFPPGQFAGVFRVASEEAGLGLTVHAGEFDGPAGIREALDTIPIRRLGHGVRAIEDQELVSELAERGIVFECCPSSNVATGVYPGFEHHPWARLRAAGCVVTLSSDDPPFFQTSLGREYAVAAHYFGVDNDALCSITRDAVLSGFAPEELREKILARAGL
jgi:adenosine deaminase